MADQQLPTQAAFFAWVSKDSRAVLGYDHRSVEDAYAHAQSRHADCRGYPVAVILTGFQAGANPMIAVVKAFEEQFPPTLVEGADEPEEQVAVPAPKDEGATKLKKVK